MSLIESRRFFDQREKFRQCCDSQHILALVQQDNMRAPKRGTRRRDTLAFVVGPVQRIITHETALLVRRGCGCPYVTPQLSGVVANEPLPNAHRSDLLPLTFSSQRADADAKELSGLALREKTWQLVCRLRCLHKGSSRPREATLQTAVAVSPRQRSFVWHGLGVMHRDVDYDARCNVIQAQHPCRPLCWCTDFGQLSPEPREQPLTRTRVARTGKQGRAAPAARHRLWRSDYVVPSCYRAAGSASETKPQVKSGGRGIRTHEQLALLAVFKTAAIGH